MLKKTPKEIQGDLFRVRLVDFIDMNHELVLLANNIDWTYFEKAFEKYYSDQGRPAMPIRFMVGCLLLKQMFNLGDETLPQMWIQNPYMQYFCGMIYFEHRFPCNPSDFSHFRKRIGKEGVEMIFAYTVKLHGKEAESTQMLSDTTVQEENISFPTDAKLAKQVIDRCRKIAAKEGIEQRQSYSRVSKQLLREAYFGTHPRRRKKAARAVRRLRTLGGRVVRELLRNMTEEQKERYREELEIMQQVLTQRKNDKDKIYSLHRPETSCIAKGKSHKPYEFGHKIGLMIHPKSLVITAIKAFKGNPHDSRTIAPLLEQMKLNGIRLPQEVVYDRGGRGVKQIEGTSVSVPDSGRKKQSRYLQQKKRKKFRRRAAIEAVISHLKQQFGMKINYLFGKGKAQINAFLSAAAWNLKKFMERLKKNLSFLLHFFTRLLEYFLGKNFRYSLH